MDALRKGISKFYGGKSKSFTSLADAAAVSSVKDFAKPEDPYNRKRKNLLARSSSLDKKPNNLLGNIGTKISMASSPSNCFPPLHPQCKKSTPIIIIIINCSTKPSLPVLFLVRSTVCC
ncbi:hypothetical protein V6Z11_D05G036400 [Gossypium hirsutum]|uniref:Uncharacterized protein n=1 Tax=Gossypium tomentosum TaxID=34277 RepID=A0A5D2KT66_GOSTO|nr:hypothetical protein ES332_D05G038200v1 [Gossypium tomentosum]